MKFLATAAAAAVLFISPALSAPTDFEIDKSHTNISFSIDHFGFSTTQGRFADWEGTLVIDQEAPENSKVSVVVKTESLDTFYPDRDKHLKSADFFNVATFPEITFNSTGVEKTGDGTLEVAGDLTILGVTKPTVLNVKVTKIGESPITKKITAGFDASTVIKRSDFGMTTFAPAIGDEVTIQIHSEAAKK